jgi:hypothetical protein
MSKKESVEKNSKLDSFAYWTAQLALSVLAVAGVQFYLQPVDPILSLTFSIAMVASIFYISLRNR